MTLSEILASPFVTNLTYSIGVVTMLFALFGLLGRITPCNRNQKLIQREITVDLWFFFLVPIATRMIQTLYLTAGVGLFFHGESDETIMRYVMQGYGPLGTLPLWLQAAIAFLLSDVILYWLHRGFHGSTMWRFHAIHHSSKHIDWHSTYRFHPVNIWLTFTLVDIIMVFLGLSLQSIMIMGTFNMLYSGMVHANLNWTFGSFKYIFASPVFHRWHHTSQAEGMDKNFAPTFPLLDVVFGTFYMPEGKVPEHYGITGSDIPESFVEQLIWPFKN